MILVWGAAIAFLLSLVAVGLPRESAPFWFQTGAELVAEISLFSMVCLLEPSGSNTDCSNPASCSI
ncbi:hypothetical protein BB934_33235 (plasmid) [Microvirga ossetica]|uniref:Uncharacterized protein n=1 Tax=Microvirga ossetica TaxID=1882682 RepID=A0A1B2ESY0_9HYPH|nr:hypothetical protein BB934_33235 [Microvirga ossetica]